MKPHTLPIKRKPAPKGFLHKLSAVTRSRKQRVAAAAPASEMESEDGSSKIARALTIIFLIHIVAVGLIFVHKHFLDGRTSSTSAAKEQTAAASTTAKPTREALPRLASGAKVYVVRPGDNYARIAKNEGIQESDIRAANDNIEIRPGLILTMPPRRIVAQEPAEVALIRESQQPATAEEPLVNEEDGLIPAIDLAGAPRAVAVSAASKASAITASNRTHTVKSGDNIWRISQQYKIKQEDLIAINGITDPRKIRIGQKLVIPE